MDPTQFDAFSRTLAVGTSRRQAVARFGAAGLLAGLAGALGRDRVVGAFPSVQADTCRLAIVANVRLGPSAGVIIAGSVPGELRGELTFALGPDGAIDSGRLRLEGGVELPVVGQGDGRALNLRVDVATDQTVVFVGTAQQRLDQCTGDVDGLLTGPRVGDLGDWHATATALGGGEGPAPGAPIATSTPSGAPTATAPAGATATSTAATATSTATLTEPPAPQTPTPTPVVCPAGTTDCAGVCVDLQTSLKHCGACGNTCTLGKNCIAGVCAYPQVCAPTETLCGNACVDVQTDPANCGACGNTCAVFETCFGGACQAPPLAPADLCAAGQTDCGGVCADLASDPANCGSCGNACVAGQLCVSQACVSESLGCGPTETLCGNVCTDLLTDLTSCGVCGNACLPGQSCLAGACAP